LEQVPDVLPVQSFLSLPEATMKTLLILRHAKSSWKDEGLTDHDRPLNKRGKRDAPRMGKLLRESDLAPDLIISSTAKRARKTAAKVAKKCEYQGVIELTGELYLAPPQSYLHVLRQVPDQYQRVMVVGHNPGLEELLSLLTRESTPLPTAALAQIELPIDAWQELNQEVHGQLSDLWLPKELDEQ
jgi:phosphohistidine phosphatase